MPPALSDDESENGETRVVITSDVMNLDDNSEVDDEDDEIPNVSTTKSGNIDEEEEEEEDDENDDEGDLDEDEFVVEKIVNHAVQDGIIKYQVKWEGYEKKSDLTFEDEDNLRENASEILEQYLKSKGGRDTILAETKLALQGKKRGRPAAGAAKNSTASKRSRRNGSYPDSETPPPGSRVVKDEWKVPAGSWENDVKHIDAARDETTGKIVVYVTWNGGQKTQHSTEVIYARCPQKMLRFYEKNIKIVKPTLDEAEDAKPDPGAAEEVAKS